MAGRTFFSRALAVTLAVALLAPGVAIADPPPAPSPVDVERAAEFKRQGDRAMETMHYPEALDAYAQAYSISHDPAILYNRGRCLQLLGRFPEALEELERFQREASPELVARVPSLGKLMTEVRSHVATLKISCNVEGARVLVRDTAAGTTPIAASLRLTAGKAPVEVLAEGFLPFRKELDLAAGSTVELAVTLVAKTNAGLLAVTSTREGSEVFVDGKSLGLAPVETALQSGTHRILVQAEGYDDTETTAVVSPGGRTEISLSPTASTSLFAKWWFWTAVGGAVVGGAVITIAATRERNPDSGTFGVGRASAPLLRF
jgi:hypothetical protein